MTFVRARHAGACAGDFAHPSAISPGDITEVITVYPRSELALLGVTPFTRARYCQWCVVCEQARFAARGYSTLALRDRHGDIWRVGADGLLHTPETAPFPIEHVQRKRGPLRVVRDRSSGG